MSDDAPDLRSALETASVPSLADEDLRRVLAAALGAAEDLDLARSVGDRVNDRDRLPEVAVEALVAADGLGAAAAVLAQRIGAVRKAATNASKRLRLALGADFAASGRRRVEASAHAATFENGGWRTVVTQIGLLPRRYVRVTETPLLDGLGKALADGQEIEGAHRERGPPTVRIGLLREDKR